MSPQTKSSKVEVCTLKTLIKYKTHDAAVV